MSVELVLPNGEEIPPGQVRENKNKWLYAFVVAVALGFVIPFLFNQFWAPQAPTLDDNTHAYLLLLKADATGKYAEAKPIFDRAYELADDAKIRYLADFFSRACQIGMEAGVASFGNNNSAENYLKGAMLGITNPLSSIDAAVLLAQKHFGHFDDNCAYADSRYRSRAMDYLDAKQKYDDAVKNQSHFSWLTAFIVMFGFFLIQKEPVLDTSKKPGTVINCLP